MYLLLINHSSRALSSNYMFTLIHKLKMKTIKASSSLQVQTLMNSVSRTDAQEVTKGSTSSCRYMES